MKMEYSTAIARSNFNGNCIYSYDLESRVKIKIGTLEGKIKRPDYEKLLEDPLLKFSGICQRDPTTQQLVPDLFVEVQLYDKGIPISPTVTTSYKPFNTRWNWNEWLILPLRFNDIPRTVQLCITIYDCGGPEKIIPIGGSTISLFNKNGLLRQGMMDLRIWPGQTADGGSNGNHSGSSSSSVQVIENNRTLTPGKGPKGNRMHHLNKLTKKHRLNQLPKLDWLDRLTFSEIETICEKEKRESTFMFLNVEFPVAEYSGIQYNILAYEKNSQDLLDLGNFDNTADNSNNSNNRIIAAAEQITKKWLPDHEIFLDNLVENKHHALSRCTRTGLSDIELKPNALIRDQLNTIVNYPPTKHLSAEEQDQVWKFRYYLSSNKRALTKFLKCVKWELIDEEQQSLELLEKWAPIDEQDALELLGPQFKHPMVRSYAVSRLKQSLDEDLLLYLLQLVQALKYENFDQIRKGLSTSSLSINEPLPMAAAAAARNLQSTISTNLSITEEECEREHTTTTTTGIITVDSLEKHRADRSTTEPIPMAMSMAASSMEGAPTIMDVSSSLSANLHGSSIPDRSHAQNCSCFMCVPKKQVTMDNLDEMLNLDKPDLATFLIYRACENTTLLNYFYWYLLIECEDHDVGVKSDPGVREMYKNVLKKFVNCLKKGKPEWQQRRALLSRQSKLISKLIEIVKIVAKENASRPKKVERLQTLLSEHDRMNFTKFEPLPFALDPEIQIQGIIAKEATLFKSSQMPCKLIFSTTTGEPYPAIFKHGDDLRQDQLILQIITLMDKLLRKENLDLKLTPYRVLATSTTHGFVQFIPSITVAEVLDTYGTIHNFFKKYYPSENDIYGISSSVMDTYVKSCAGYCVITYILGVGDRHLDNLLLTSDGRLFHIDFGYILGRDPKPMPPPMKLSKEMVEAMGGIYSEHYQEFRKLCYTAFLHLRRHANLILNLFSLMVGASVPDIALEPDKTVKKVLDKFRLDLNDEAAVKHMQELIDISVTSFMPALVEFTHKFTQMLRK